MGFNIKLLSQIGDDLAGKEVLKVMKKFKVNTDLVNIIKNSETGYSVIFLNKARERTILIFRGASDFSARGGSASGGKITCTAEN